MMFTSTMNLRFIPLKDRRIWNGISRGPNPAFFRNFEQKIIALQKLGIEADVILFHPYDWGKWNLDKMNSEQAVFYLRDLIARIAACSKVWWSMANEYDIMRKSDQEWEKYFRVIQTYDPVSHREY